MFEKLLALYDFSRVGRRALEWAAGLGEAFGSRPKIAHAVEWSESRPAAAGEVRKRIEAEMPGCPVEVVEGRTVPALLQLIGRESPDLVVMGTTGLGDLPHVLMGSVAEKIVRHSPSPVLVVRRDSAWPPKSALLPIDFAGPFEETLTLAEGLAAKLPLRFCMIYVESGRPPGAEISVPPPDLADGLSAAEKRATARLQQIRAGHPSLDLDYVFSMGPAAGEIGRAAKDRNFDLILIPTHSRSGLGHFLMGGVAEQVVRYAPCAVLSHCPRETAGLRRRSHV